MKFNKEGKAMKCYDRLLIILFSTQTRVSKKFDQSVNTKKDDEVIL